MTYNVSSGTLSLYTTTDKHEAYSSQHYSYCSVTLDLLLWQIVHQWSIK